MSRKTDRKHAFNLIFELEFHRGTEPGELMECYFRAETFAAAETSLTETADRAYIERTLTGVAELCSELDAEIAANARGWTLERLAKTDLAILRLAVYELFHGGDVPPKVAINEAVELAKTFSGGDSPSFVNGLLGQLVKARET